nr:LLM class flavin-dependent oxidoreductase [Streptomyces neyagawaensis]
MPDWMRQVGSWPGSPLTLIKEYARALRLLIAGEPGPENGWHVRCEGVVLTEIPDIVPPVIPGVRGPKSQRVAGEVADGLLLAEPAAPGYITASLRHLGPAASGNAPEVVVYDGAAVDDEEAALARVRAALESVGEPEWAAHIAPCPSPGNCAPTAPPAPTPGTSPGRCPPTGSAR